MNLTSVEPAQKQKPLTIMGLLEEYNKSAQDNALTQIQMILDDETVDNEIIIQLLSTLQQAEPMQDDPNLKLLHCSEEMEV